MSKTSERSNCDTEENIGHEQRRGGLRTVSHLQLLVRRLRGNWKLTDKAEDSRISQ